MSLSKCTTQYKSNHQRCSSTEHQIQVGANNCTQNTASPNTKATVQPSMNQFNGASTRYQSNFGEVHLYKGLHLCDTSQLTKAIGATKPTQRLAQSTFASSHFVYQKKTHPKILPSTPAICLYTLWTFTMMFFKANLTQSTLYIARTINLKRPTN